MNELLTPEPTEPSAEEGSTLNSQLLRLRGAADSMHTALLVWENHIAHLEAQQTSQQATSADLTASQPEPEQPGGSDFMDWMADRLADPEVRAGYLAAHAREVREQVARELIPVVAHKGRNDTDLSLLDEAAHRVEHGYSLDSNITTAVVRLIRNAIHIARKEQP